jgi:hypothetical protein
MRTRTRHPRLAAAACRAYGLAIRLCPTHFRQAFGHEIAVTFRQQVEDVLDSGSIVMWMKFVFTIVIDWMRTCATLRTESRIGGSVSILGLGESDAALGSIDSSNVDVSFVFAVAGVVLILAGWYAYLTVLRTYAVQI